jgi:hypothetical protein
METARDLVAVVVELASGVQHREDDFGRGLAAFMEVDRDAAAVVDHGDGVVDVDCDVDLVAVPGQGLVDRVVDNLVDEVMQSGGPGRADIHRRPLANGFEAFENLDLVRAVVVGLGRADTMAVVLRRYLRRRRLILTGVLIGIDILHQTRIGMMT